MLFGNKKILGLDIGTSSVKVAELESSRKGWQLNRFAIYPVQSGLISGGDIMDPTSVSMAVRSALEMLKSKRKNAVTGMFGTSVIVKKITMPAMDLKLVSEQIRWEAEQYIPFDINEISLEHSVLKNVRTSNETMDVLLVAAKQEFIYRYLETVEASGLKCTAIDVSGFALANCFEYNYGIQPGRVALLNIGAGVANLVVLEQGEIIFSRDILVGGLNYTADIQRSMGVSQEEAESLKISASLGQEAPTDVLSIMQSTTDSVVDEIRNSFEFFSTTAGGASIERVFVTGGSIFVPGLIDAISKSIGLRHEVMDPMLKISFNSKVLSAPYISQIRSICGVALGLGLREIGDA
jgi:type IV pilus assembly protein PilM